MINDLVRSFLVTLRETQYLPPEELAKQQRDRLERLVRHARAHVPFYRQSGRLDLLFDRCDRIVWDRWPELPLLTRSDVQHAGATLRSEKYQGAGLPYASSGTTGEPVTVWHSDVDDRLVRTAVILRDLEHYQVDPTRRLLFLGVTLPDGLQRKRDDVWYRAFASLGIRGERFDVTDALPPAALIDAVDELQPDYLGASPTTLELMAAHDVEHRLGRAAIKTVMATAGHFSEGGKAAVETAFGCGIMQIYGSNECARMARSCPRCGRYHVHAEVVHVEVVGDDGEYKAPGEAGWLIATPLYNFAMPLIRYHHGDRAVVGQTGNCAITLPALDAIFGKEQKPFVFPGGLAIRPKVPLEAVVSYLGANAFQVAQVAEDRCELRLVPGRLAVTHAVRRHDALSQIDLVAGPGWDYRIVDALPKPTPRAKVPLLVSELR